MKRKYKKAYIKASLLCWFLVLFAVVLNAQEAFTSTEYRTIAHKPYVRVSSGKIAGFSRDARNVDVKFRERFERIVAVPANQIRVREQTYRIGQAIRLQNNIIGLVPQDHADSLRLIDGLERGQELSVYGITLRRRAGDNFILIERLVGENDVDAMAEAIRAGYELRIEAENRHSMIIDEKGQYNFEFGCRYQDGETEEILVDVSQYSRQEFEERRAELQADAEAEEIQSENDTEEPLDEQRSYSRYEPRSIYQAIGDSRNLDARFSATVREIRRDFPSRVRDAEGQQIRIGGAFETSAGPIFCVIPANNEDSVNKLDMLMEGMDVQIKGTTLQRVRGERFFLVDEFSVPGIINPPQLDFVWIVSFLSGNEKPRIFHEEGEYRFRVPCQHQEGEYERIVANLRAVQIIEMDLDQED